jgi:hypothetical protein
LVLLQARKEVSFIKVKTVVYGFIFVVVIIALFHNALGAIADFLIHPSVNVPDNIPLPGGKK